MGLKELKVRQVVRVMDFMLPKERLLLVGQT